MNKIFKMLAVTALTFSTSSAVMANNDPTDVSALTGEYVATNPGFEAAIPYWIKVDHNGDGTKDGYDFHFDVFKLGTTTKLFSTPVQYLPYSLPACIQDIDSKDVNFKRIGNNVVLSTIFRTYCSTPYTSHVYVVNISAAGKTSWVKSFSGRLIGTGILPDKNGNGIGELSVIIGTGGFTDENDDKNNSLYVYDGETGTSLSTPKKYVIEHLR